MRTILLLAIAVLGTQLTFAQMNAVIYSEAGEKFTVYLNGEAKNDKPQTNVKLQGLTSEFFQCRIDFEDASLADFSNNNFACHQGMEVTYIVKKNKKGEYVLRFYTENPVSSSAPVTNENSNKQFAVADDPNYEQTQGSNSTNSQTSSGNITTNVSGTNTTGGNISMNINANGATGGVGMNISAKDGQNGGQVGMNISANDTQNGGNVSMNMNVDGVNFGMNINVEDSSLGTSQNANSNITSTTTTTTKINGAETTNQTTNTTNGKVVVAGNSGCIRSMDNESFAKSVQSVNSKGFDETKLSTAKQIIKANCFTSEQIKTMLGTFGFEETKLDFAKFAYDYCFDTNNYYILNDAFGFDATIEELNEYLQSK